VKKDTSALVAAAIAFDAELAAYARLGDLFVRTPFTTLKHLERANATLGELAEAEGRLSAAGQQLIAALSAARGEQEALAKSVVDRAPELTVRNKRLQELMAALGELAGEVAKINQLAAATNGDATAPAKPDATALSASVLALSARAEELAKSAREADYAELAEQAHSLHQRLQAIAKKLHGAGA
jgi:chromosome segregation ATPase